MKFSNVWLLFAPKCKNCIWMPGLFPEPIHIQMNICPSKWKTREFITGFTGSYGTIVLTKTEVGLWTDTRYFLQAEEQLKGTGIKMYKLRVPEAISPETWLSEILNSGNRVGIDAQTISVSGYRNLQKALDKKNIELVNTPDLFDVIWENRSQVPKDKIFELENSFFRIFTNGKAESDNIAKLNQHNVDFLVVSMLDELAWLNNLRGSDISYNPVFMGFGFVGKDENYLFVNQSKITSDLLNVLEKDGICIKEYEFFLLISIGN
jgi:Xaa-Pro aminopeptidase